LNASLWLRAPIAVAPVLLFLAALIQGDSYKLIRLRTVLGLVAIGALAAGASYVANIYASELFAGGFQAYSRYVSPWIEEALKAAVLMFLIRTRRVGLPVDAGIAGFAIGTGFAMIENLYYLESRPGIALGVHVIRGFGTAIMHGGTATVLAMISVTLYERRPNAGLYLFLPGYLAAVALHSGFNFLLVKPALAAIATTLVLPLVVYLVFQDSENALREWLDEDLDSKVELLELINRGAFLDSHAGRMLGALRDRFRGEDLADMLCLLRLHGELALRAKGVLLLRESGMEEPPLDAETRDKLAELEQLERALGRTGMLALRPLMMATGKDIWQLRLLKQ
jgi:RsiW-degrading membrane proteinase PrsW (M82 family)